MRRDITFVCILMMLSGCASTKTVEPQQAGVEEGAVEMKAATESKSELQTGLVEDLDASTHKVYFSFSEGGAVEIMDENTEEWDVSFEGTDVRVNGRAQLLQKPYKSVGIAPADGYRRDTAEETAIPTGSDKGWYSYNFNTHVITVIDNTIIFETARKRYAKMEILSFYKGDDDGSGAPMFYTFRYAYQPDGSRSFQ